MPETIKPAEVRQRLGDLLDRVAGGREQFVIERRGRPMAALVPFERLRRLERAAELELLSMLDGHARRLTAEQAREVARRVKARSGG